MYSNVQNPTVRKWGKQGKHLVFLHYFGGSADSWQWVTELLENDHRCVALNLPGFGRTTPLSSPSIEGFARWIGETLIGQGIHQCTMIGHSMSGKLALAVAANYPDLEVEQLILIAPSPPTREPMPEEEKERMLNHPDRREAEKTVQKATVLPLPPERATLATETQLQIHHPTWRWWLLEGMDHSIADQLINIRIPVTLIASQDDPAIPFDTITDEVLGLLPQAELVSTSSVGHLLPLEAPAWVAEQIRSITKG